MKNLFFILCCLLMPALLSAQNPDIRSLPPFQKIGISGGFAEVILQEGNAESVSIEGAGTNLDKIITDVEDNSLKIKTKKGSSSMNKVKITVTYKHLTALANSGSSDIILRSVIKGDKFEFASSGSGDLKGSSVFHIVPKKRLTFVP